MTKPFAMRLRPMSTMPSPPMNRSKCPLNLSRFHTFFNVTGIPPLKEHREHFCEKLFQSIMTDPNNKIYNFLSERNESSYHLRHETTFDMRVTRTEWKTLRDA